MESGRRRALLARHLEQVESTSAAERRHREQRVFMLPGTGKGLGLSRAHRRRSACLDERVTRAACVLAVSLPLPRAAAISCCLELPAESLADAPVRRKGTLT